MGTPRVTTAPSLHLPRPRWLRLAVPVALPLDGRAMRRAGLLCLVGIAFAAPPAAQAPTVPGANAPIAR